jgi:hypothetical protein
MPAKSGIGAITEIGRKVPPEMQVPCDRFITSLSFSHFAELIAVEDSLIWQSKGHCLKYISPGFED